MMHRNKILIACSLAVLCAGVLLSALFLTNILGAQASFNQQVNYQGKLASSSGVAVADGQYCMNFALYNQLATGTLLWSEEWNASNGKVTTASGLFSIMLGSHTSLSSLNFNSAALYLEVQLDAACDGVYEEVFAPRKQLGAVPASFEAKQLGGYTWAAPDIIGSTTPNTATFSWLSATSGLKILEGGTSPTKYTIFQGGDQSADVTYTLPAALPGASQFLQSSSTGALTWASAPSTSPGGSAGQVQYNNGSAFAGSSGMTFNATTGLFTVTGGLSGSYLKASNLTAASIPYVHSDNSFIDSPYFTFSSAGAGAGQETLTVGGNGGQMQLISYHGGGEEITGSSLALSGVSTINDIIDLESYSFSDGSAQASLNWGNRILYASDGTTPMLNWATAGTANFGANVVITTATGSFGAFRLGTSTTGGYVLTANAGGEGTWQPAAGGSPGGSSTYVQYNSGGSFAGTASFAYDNTTLSITSAGPQEKLLYNATNYASFSVGSTGNLTIAATSSSTGGDILLQPGTTGNPNILSDSGTIVFGGSNNTYNENLTFDFESTANNVSISTTTGVTDVNFNALSLTTAATGTFGTGIKIKEGGGSPSYYTTFQGGDQSANITYVLPATSANGLLKNSTGTLSWDTTAYVSSESDPIVKAINGMVKSNGSTISAASEGTDFYKPGGTDIVVADGGTGRSSHTAFGLIAGGTTTTGAQQSITNGATVGQILRSAGGGALPSWSTATYPATATSTGTILRANGTNWLPSSTTYPDTITANQVLFATGTNIVNGSSTLTYNGVTLSAGEFTTAGTGSFATFKLGTSTTAGYVLTANASGVGTWQPAGSTSPGGSAGQVQYNSGSAFAGSAGMTFNSSTGAFTVAGVVTGATGSFSGLTVSSGGATIDNGDITFTTAAQKGFRWPGGSRLYEQTSGAGGAERMLYQPNGDRFDILNEAGNSYASDAYGGDFYHNGDGTNYRSIYGAGADAQIYFTGSVMMVQSDVVTSTDSLQLRGGTNGIAFNIGATEEMLLNATTLDAKSNVITTTATGSFGAFRLGTSTTGGYVLTANAGGEGTWQPSASGVPYTGATSNLNLGNYAFITTGTSSFGALGIGPMATSPATTFHLSGTSSANYAQIDTGLNFDLVTAATAPTATLAGEAGSITVGQHRYSVTFVTDLGETNLANYSNTITATAGNSKVNLTDIPTSTDYRVKARRIYRTVDPAGDGGADSLYHFKLLTTLNDNTTTTYQDNTADSGLTGGADYAGYYDMDNSTNKFIMADGVQVLSTGIKNTSLGYGAGDAVVAPGNSNTSVGVNAGTRITTGTNNTVIGMNGGTFITTGSGNSAVGAAALLYTTGGYNAALGSYAGFSIAGGQYNTALGDYAMCQSSYSNTLTGSNNVAVGVYSGYSLWTSGGNNTLVGAYTGQAITTTSNNLFLGYYAGKYETAGSTLIVDTLDRTNEAGQRTAALMYGTFNATVASQQLTVNAGTLNFNAGTDTDLAVNFLGTTASGTLKWMEDENYFEFLDAAAFDAGVKILETGSTPTYYTTFLGGDQTSSLTYTLPTVLPTSAKFLQSTASGVLSWATVSASPGGSSGQVQYNSGSAFAGSAGMTFNSATGAFTARKVMVNDGTNDIFGIYDPIDPNSYPKTVQWVGIGAPTYDGYGDTTNFVVGGNMCLQNITDVTEGFIGVEFKSGSNYSDSSMMMGVYIDAMGEPTGYQFLDNTSSPIVTIGMDGSIALKTLGSSGSTAVCWDEGNSNQLTYCGADMAEYAPVTDDVEGGDIVVVSKDKKNSIDDKTSPFILEKSSTPYQQELMGVIGYTGATLGKKKGEHYKPLVLIGRVPVKVCAENGEINPGDWLTSSSIPGVAMKATAQGSVIGKALEKYSDSGVGNIMVFINLGLFGGELSQAEVAGNGSIEGVGSETLLKQVTDTLYSLGISIDNGIAKIKNLMADNFTAKKANIDVASLQKIQIVDQETKEIYCTWISNGQWQKSKGECGSVESTIATADVFGEEILEDPSNKEKETSAEDIAEQAVTEAQKAAKQAVQQATQKLPQQIEKKVEEEVEKQLKEKEQPGEQTMPEEAETLQPEQQEEEEPPQAEIQPEAQPEPVEVAPQPEEQEPTVGDLIQNTAAEVVRSVWHFLSWMFSSAFKNGASYVPSPIKNYSAGLSSKINKFASQNISAGLEQIGSDIKYAVELFKK